MSIIINPETGVFEEEGIVGTNPILNENGQFTRIDPVTGQIQESGWLKHLDFDDWHPYPTKPPTETKTQPPPSPPTTSGSSGSSSSSDEGSGGSSSGSSTTSYIGSTGSVHAPQPTQHEDSIDGGKVILAYVGFMLLAGLLSYQPKHEPYVPPKRTPRKNVDYSAYYAHKARLEEERRKVREADAKRAEEYIRQYSVLPTRPSVDLSTLCMYALLTAVLAGGVITHMHATTAHVVEHALMLLMSIAGLVLGTIFTIRVFGHLGEFRRYRAHLRAYAHIHAGTVR